MAYTNSPLVKYTNLSPNHSGQRTHSIDRITPHCVVGQLTAEGICACFPAGREASCNYGIGKDGKIALCVEEKIVAGARLPAKMTNEQSPSNVRPTAPLLMRSTRLCITP